MLMLLNYLPQRKGRFTSAGLYVQCKTNKAKEELICQYLQEV